MKINIGEYVEPWYLRRAIYKLKHVGFKEETLDKLCDKLDDTWLDKLVSKVGSIKKRKVDIHIDRYDTWSMDHTLALIILPMLKQLKATKHGAPSVEDVDVPEELRSTNAIPNADGYGVDSNWFKRWDFILDEMIWAFEQLSSDKSDCEGFWLVEPVINFDAPDGECFVSAGKMDEVGYKKHADRIENGLRLFGVYYRGLWD